MFILKQKTNQFVKNCFWLSLMAAIFLLPCQGLLAAEFSSFVTPPQINSLINGQAVSGKIMVKGTSLNYSQTKIYLDDQFVGQADAVIGTQGWQDFELLIDQEISFSAHTLGCVAEYFNNTKSVTTTINFVYEPRLIGPTLFDPVLNKETNFQQPWLVGVAPNNSLVEIFIDEKFNGEILTGAHPSGVIDFKYQPQEKLVPGFHVARARVRVDGRRSNFSNEVIFEVRAGNQILKAPGLKQLPEKFIAPVPAPTLLEPKSGFVIKPNELFLKAVVHNEHYVKIFVDEELFAEFMPVSHPSGVTSFIWQAEKPLAPGSHQVFAQAINPRGEISGRSNVLQFIVLPSQIFVSGFFGKIAAASVAEPASDIQPENIVDEEIDFGKQNTWLRYLSYLIILIILAAIILIIWRLRKDKKSGLVDEEKIEIKIKGKDLEVLNSEVANETEPVIRGPEISYGLEEEKENPLPPPPPPDLPTLGI